MQIVTTSSPLGLWMNQELGLWSYHIDYLLLLTHPFPTNLTTILPAKSPLYSQALDFPTL